MTGVLATEYDVEHVFAFDAIFRHSDSHSAQQPETFLGYGRSLLAEDTDPRLSRCSVRVTNVAGSGVVVLQFDVQLSTTAWPSPRSAERYPSVTSPSTRIRVTISRSVREIHARLFDILDEIVGAVFTLSSCSLQIVLAPFERPYIGIIVRECSEERSQRDVVLTDDDVMILAVVDDAPLDVEDGDARSLNAGVPRPNGVITDDWLLMF